MIVLMLLAPLLRPLRSPGVATARERATLEAVRAVLHDKTLALNAASLGPGAAVLRVGDRAFSQDPPVFDVALAGVGWAIERGGVRADVNPNFFAYLLTLFAVALPTAVAGGLVYRTARVFELPRTWRFGLALSCVLATGWLSYATVLLPHAPAAAGVMAAIAGVVQFAGAKRPGRAVGWLLLSGLFAALAGVIEPLAMWTLAAVLVAVVSSKVPVRWRVAGVVLTLAGAAAPIAMHLTINPRITGDWRPPRWHVYTPPPPAPASEPDDADDGGPTGWQTLGRGVGRLIGLTVGSHGLFSHFPVLIVGVAGAGLIVRRHWTGAIKALAAATLVAVALALAYRMTARPDAVDANYAAPRLVVFAPALMIWAGAFLRRSHGTLVWIAMGVALGISVLTTLLGALSVAPPDGYSHYTFAQAIERLVLPSRE